MDPGEPVDEDRCSPVPVRFPGNALKLVISDKWRDRVYLGSIATREPMTLVLRPHCKKAMTQLRHTCLGYCTRCKWLFTYEYATVP